MEGGALDGGCLNETLRASESTNDCERIVTTAMMGSSIESPSLTRVGMSSAPDNSKSVQSSSTTQHASSCEASTSCPCVSSQCSVSSELESTCKSKSSCKHSRKPGTVAKATFQTNKQSKPVTVNFLIKGTQLLPND